MAGNIREVQGIQPGASELTRNRPSIGSGKSGPPGVSWRGFGRGDPSKPTVRH